ncbi:MAG: PAS domain S-box protein [Parvibaculum sp.]|uniref:ATP-binding protein n=1 Tax=Parvibaculum sp. TaxID=2024848 RepID=UPI0025DA5B2D|nr:ATP-binding protein [Parvibaculum sp.]MCE9649361.1 PAS domain S-box protein [Parvibaculum sp.]
MVDAASGLLKDQRFKAALRIALVYLISSYAYLYASDWVVGALVPTPWQFAVNVSKGFIYVTVTGAALLYFIHRALVAAQLAEAQFQHIFEASPDGILLATTDGKIAAANPALAEMLGRSRAEMIGKGRDIMLDPQSPDVLEAIRQRERHGEVRQRLMFIRKDGEEFPAYAAFRSFKLPNGEARICGIIRDLSETEKRDAKYREGERLRLVGHLAGGVAHDFNNLLTVISGNAEILLDMAEQNTPQHRAANIIWTAGQQAAQLVRHLLAFARRQSLDPAAFSVHTRLNDLMPLLTKAVGSHVRIDLDCSEDTWLAYADASQFENAVLNLVLNAKDAMTDDPGIRVATANVAIGPGNPLDDMLVPGDYVALSVAEHGSGMTPEVLARAVEPFFTTKEAGQGSGLGLSTVFGFAKQSGGHLDIQSEEGEGTTVTIYLPRPVGYRATQETQTAPGAIKGGHERILIVEDDQLVRTFLENALSQLGYRVVAVQDAQEALDVLGTDGGGVDLLVADVVLPGAMNGRDLAAKLKNVQPGLGVLFISGFPDEHKAQDDPTYSPALKKPFHVQDMAQRIRDALDGIE